MSKSTINAIHKSLGLQMSADAKFYSSYSRWDEAKGGFESWREAVGRVMDMHRDKFASRMSKKLEAFMAKAEAAYSSQLVLGAQRALQFGGPQLRKHEAKMYNCSTSHADRAAFFQEAMYLLLCGCGVGFSVQQRHVSKLPEVRARAIDEAKVFVVPDSIEGWSDAFGVLLSSYFVDGGTFPAFKGVKVLFDLSAIRAEGMPINGGFKAPGPEPLRKALQKCEELIERALLDAEGDTVGLRPIQVYDFVMHMSDAVLAGGVRRSATICLFDLFDAEMMAAKTGDWFMTNPQRGRSNNSVVLKRGTVTREEWDAIKISVKDFGEPGFVWVDDYDICYNPCVEIGMLPVCQETGESGFQFCNLVEVNGGRCVTPELLYEAVEAGAILGTLQADYTDFKYLGAATKRITEREALLGVSITGWMNNPDVLFDEEVLRKAARIVKAVNREVAALIGINPAARTTCAKPSGNASVLLQTASGIHGEHAPRYIRNVTLNKSDEVAQLLMRLNPKMVEDSVWSNSGTDFMVSFPVVAKEGSIFKSDLMGVKQLEYVLKAQQTWVEEGTNVDLCVRPYLRHNISNTISMDSKQSTWDEVFDFIWDNQDWFAGVSLSAAAGDKAYVQAPFAEVLTPLQMLEKYGSASMFASGLVVDGKHAFADNLWQACQKAMEPGIRLTPELTMACDESTPSFQAFLTGIADPLQRDWVRRFHKFAKNFFGGDLVKTEFCLKDSFLLHKWTEIERTMKEIDFVAELCEQKADIDVNTLGAIACAGGVCEMNFGN